MAVSRAAGVEVAARVAVSEAAAALRTSAVETGMLAAAVTVASVAAVKRQDSRAEYFGRASLESEADLCAADT